MAQIFYDSVNNRQPSYEEVIGGDGKLYRLDPNEPSPVEVPYIPPSVVAGLAFPDDPGNRRQFRIPSASESIPSPRPPSVQNNDGWSPSSRREPDPAPGQELKPTSRPVPDGYMVNPATNNVIPAPIVDGMIISRRMDAPVVGEDGYATGRTRPVYEAVRRRWYRPVSIDQAAEHGLIYGARRDENGNLVRDERGNVVIDRTIPVPPRDASAGRPFQNLTQDNVNRINTFIRSTRKGAEKAMEMTSSAARAMRERWNRTAEAAAQREAVRASGATGVAKNLAIINANARAAQDLARVKPVAAGNVVIDPATGQVAVGASGKSQASGRGPQFTAKQLQDMYNEAYYGTKRISPGRLLDNDPQAFAEYSELMNRAKGEADATKKQQIIDEANRLLFDPNGRDADPARAQQIAEQMVALGLMDPRVANRNDGQNQDAGSDPLAEFEM